MCLKWRERFYVFECFQCGVEIRFSWDGARAVVHVVK